MRKLTFLAALLMGLSLAACSSDDDETPPPPPVGFTQPAGTVAVNFKVDDTANQVFTDGQLKWKGSMLHDPATRKITFDGTWSGGTNRQGFATLYDDGPWNQNNATTGQPGHEPAGSTAGDHIWGVTVFATPPATGTQGYEFGLIDELYEATFGNGWIWVGSNGTFSVAAGATAPIDAVATPFVLPAFGTIDMQLTIDTNTGQLGPGTWDTSVVKVKGSAWAWGNITLADDGTKGDATAGDKIYTFHLSEYVGAGTNRPHTGLLASTNKPEFVFVFGTGDGVEYKDVNGDAEATGVAAAVKPAATWTPVTVQIYSGAGENGNTYITVP